MEVDHKLVYEIIEYIETLQAHFNWNLQVKPKFFCGDDKKSDRYYGLIAEANRLIEGAELHPPGHEHEGEVRAYRLTYDGYLLLELGSYGAWLTFDKERRNYILKDAKNQQEVRDSVITTNKWSMGSMIVSAFIAALTLGAICVQVYIQNEDIKQRAIEKATEEKGRELIQKELQMMRLSIDSGRAVNQSVKVQIEDSVNTY